jgi:hypothetical protein
MASGTEKLDLERHHGGEERGKLQTPAGGATARPTGNDSIDCNFGTAQRPGSLSKTAPSFSSDLVFTIVLLGIFLPFPHLYFLFGYKSCRWMLLIRE